MNFDTASQASDVNGQLAAASAALSAVSHDLSVYRALDDAALLAVNTLNATVVKAALATASLIAGEVARRSAPELGSKGLAQRLGHRTSEQFIKTSTGVTTQQAVTAVRVGRMMQDVSADPVVDVTTGELTPPHPVQPWLKRVAAGVLDGSISAAAAESIDRGLGTPCAGVSEADLAVAAAALCAEAVAGTDPDRLFRRARALRDEIDAAGIAEREAQRREQRALSFVQLPNGMSRLVWTMDPETAVTVKDLYDRATSPKLGGVRFVDKTQSALADKIAADERTPAQLASDTFEHLLRVGADTLATDSATGTADGGAAGRFLLGSGAPVIHIAATRDAVEKRKGAAHLRGQADPVSITTLERLACSGGHRETGFDQNGIPLDLGRDQRLFTAKQKQVLALKWGGCVHPGCDRPPSWTEAHHIEHWWRDHGKSDIADGVLLCKHHHMLHHNTGWEITRDDHGRYWLTPPPTVDPTQTPIELTTRSRVMHDLQRAS